MLDHAALTPEALSYFQSLPLSYQVAMNHSNPTFRTLEDLKAYEERNLQGTDSVLYQRLPRSGHSLQLRVGPFGCPRFPRNSK